MISLNFPGKKKNLLHMNTELRKQTLVLADIDDGFANYNELFDLVFLLLVNFLLLVFLLLVFLLLPQRKILLFL